MTPAEQVLLPKMGHHLASLKSDSLTSMFDKFYELDDRLYAVQEIMDNLEYFLVQYTNLLDGITHNQDIMDNHLNELCHVVQGQGSALHKKLDPLIHLGTLPPTLLSKGPSLDLYFSSLLLLLFLF